MKRIIVEHQHIDSERSLLPVITIFEGGHTIDQVEQEIPYTLHRVGVIGRKKGDWKWR